MNSRKPSLSINYFELFSFPESFDIDLKQLKARLREMQTKFHPDRFAGGSEEEKMTAVKNSSLLNDAFAVLSSPVKRANYILELNGVSLSEDRKIDQSILMEQIEIREKLESLGEIEEAERKISMLDDFSDELEAQFSESRQQFSKLHKELRSDKNSTNAEILEQMKQSLSKMLFLDKAIHEVGVELEMVS